MDLDVQTRTGSGLSDKPDPEIYGSAALPLQTMDWDRVQYPPLGFPYSWNITIRILFI